MFVFCSLLLSAERALSGRVRPDLRSESWSVLHLHPQVAKLQVFSPLETWTVLSEVGFNSRSVPGYRWGLIPCKRERRRQSSKRKYFALCVESRLKTRRVRPHFQESYLNKIGCSTGYSQQVCLAPQSLLGDKFLNSKLFLPQIDLYRCSKEWRKHEPYGEICIYQFGPVNPFLLLFRMD